VFNTAVTPLTSNPLDGDPDRDIAVCVAPGEIETEVAVDGDNRTVVLAVSPGETLSETAVPVTKTAVAV